MKYFFLALISFALLGSYSCRRSCTLSAVSIYFNGFDSAQLANIIVSQYNKGSNFSKPNNVIVYVNDSAGLRTGSDTAYMMSLYGVYFPIDPGYDYIVALPATAGSYTITSISVGHEKTGDMDNSHTYTCSLSWNLNGRTNTDGSNISGNPDQEIDINNY